MCRPESQVGKGGEKARITLFFLIIIKEIIIFGHS